MKLVVLILNRIEMMEKLLCGFSEAKISGATIIESTGMAQALYNMEDGAFLGSLRFFPGSCQRRQPHNFDGTKRGADPRCQTGHQ